MKIAIDLDGTVFSCHSFLYEFITHLVEKKKSSRNLIFNIVNTDDEDYNPFYTKSISVLNPSCYYDIEGALKYINEWYEIGHKIVLLSRRPNIKILKSTLVALLDSYDVSFTLLIIGCSNKAKFCEKYKIDVLIDDTKKHCEDAFNLGINSIYFNENSVGNSILRTNSPTKMFKASCWESINLDVKEVERTRKKELSFLR